MGEIILVRHCATSGQHSEAELTGEGARSALELVETLAKLEPDAIYSSPYRRALATIEPFAAHAKLPIQRDVRLRERELNAHEDWLEHLQHSFADHDYKLPGGESLREARARGLEALREIRERRAIVVSHGNLIAALLGLDFEAWRAIPSPALFRLDMRQQSR